MTRPKATPEQAVELEVSAKRRGRLNPAWVAQLQGYPVDWLDINYAPSGMQSFRKSSRLLGWRS